MMGIMWQALYGILSIEIVFVILLLLPLPSNTVRGWVVKGTQLIQTPNAKKFQLFLLATITALFFDSLRSINYIEKQHAAEAGRTAAHDQLIDKMRLFRNQRNAYITGFCLLLTFVLYRVQAMIIHLHSSRSELKLVRKELKELQQCMPKDPPSKKND
jgi:hypothetical protein